MKTIKIIITILLALIGAISVGMTLAIIFDIKGFAAKQGNIVWFILYTNLICGLIYLYSAWILKKKSNRAKGFLFFSLILLLVAFVRLKFYIQDGGLYEMRTIVAMTGRTLFTAVMLGCVFLISKAEKKSSNRFNG